ncbi:MAG: hypothetical protein AVDCRST_MAG25-1702 [uncultured Rubrobacteraceae bacterium]|uniref:Uncharacterized protein n=1 Tax=uncultured Rubrobacteraceae bacterium TaxID=349277 RepID=A0A6J4RHC0_9ACTN|nr:MAG: hypothetical protein AVDCRST_MAG25-1702 [uncultured Rubrobacteraceae bacterium]
MASVRPDGTFGARSTRSSSQEEIVNGGSMVKLVWGIATLISLLVVLVLLMTGNVSL